MCEKRRQRNRKWSSTSYFLQVLGAWSEKSQLEKPVRASWSEKVAGEMRSESAGAPRAGVYGAHEGFSNNGKLLLGNS